MIESEIDERKKEKQKEANHEAFNIANRKAVESTRKKKKENYLEEFNLAHQKKLRAQERKRKRITLKNSIWKIETLKQSQQRKGMTM